MNVYLKGLYSCALRRQKFHQYKDFLEANNHNIVNKPYDADVILVWTCAFRADVRDYCISELRRYQSDYGAQVIAAGCLPDIAPVILQENFRGIVLPWKKDEMMMEEFFGSSGMAFDNADIVFSEKHLCDDVAVYKQENPDKDAIFHDQFLKLVVCEGCNYKCAYCSERLAFPPFRSFDAELLYERLNKMVQETGKYEVVLLGDCLGDWGSDIDSSFPELIEKLRSIDERITFALNNYNLADFIKHYDLMEGFLRNGYFSHLNFPIQSASDRILELMQRPYTRADLERVFGLIKEIDFREFDTHIIIGFPGEREEDLEQTIDFMLQYRPKYVLASTYMEMPQMDSAKISEKVQPDVKTERMKRFTEEVTNAGIICNSDEGDLIQSRFERLAVD